MCVFTRVCVQVGLQHPGRHEGALTDVALVGFLPGVRADMLLQVAGLLEALVTPTASEEREGGVRGLDCCSCCCCCC